jgi:hypothetical protein
MGHRGFGHGRWKPGAPEFLPASAQNAVMPLDVLGRTVSHDSRRLRRSISLTSLAARYTDRASEYITLAERSG